MPVSLPPRTVSVAKEWGPLLSGLAALMAALGTLIAALAGAFRPNMDATNQAVREMTAAVKSLERWADKHEQRHDLEKLSDEQRKREVDSVAASARKDLDHLADRVERRR